MTTASGSIRYGLPGDVQEYRWKGMKHFLRAIDYEYRLFHSHTEKQKDRFVIFSEVTESTYLEEIQSSQDKSITVSVESYSSLEKILLLTMTTQAHEQAARCISWSLAIKLNGMGLEDEIYSTGAAEYKGKDSTKRADETFRPTRLPQGRSEKWPSVVVETGYSESRAKLERDAAWWITESGGDVKAVLTIKLNHKFREMSIHKWVPVVGVTRNLSSRQQQVPSLSRRVIISRRSDEPHARVTNVPLTITFEELFLRQPQQPHETDIIYGVDELRKIAEKVWSLQQFSDGN